MIDIRFIGVRCASIHLNIAKRAALNLTRSALYQKTGKITGLKKIIIEGTFAGLWSGTDAGQTSRSFLSGFEIFPSG